MESPLERRSGEDAKDESNRSETRRDRDRILYADSFRRLEGVTQVASSTRTVHLHNRLTHSLKVEQVGYSLFTRLTGDGAKLDTESLHAIETACMAHDLGHPPFGHAGEQELDSLVTCEEHRKHPRPYESRISDACSECKLEDGFEGNAQTLRIITALEGHRSAQTSKSLGLDLTRLSLAAVTKYPWTRGARNEANEIIKILKWGAYDCDFPTLKWILGANQSSQTIEAQVMDWADDISYAVHDVEDFYRAGLIPIDDYRANEKTLRLFFEYVDGELGELSVESKQDFEDLIELFPKSRFTKAPGQIERLDRLRSRLITQFINGASLDENGNLYSQPVTTTLNAILKQLIWYHIIDEPKLVNIQTGQRLVLKDIFETLLPVAESAHGVGTDRIANERDLRRLPYGLRSAIQVGFVQMRNGSSYSKRQVIARGLLDYMAGLTDAEAYTMHAVLKGNEYSGLLL